ncbi:MAG TPA: twin-arginine translocase TatA/TatE family subunit [Solirubrobacteraceae bacterium]|nr:twin-arginine translocase TatA/TatE family subunit [Solirubrobacteraceae bacterium]
MGIENPVHLLFIAIVALVVLGPKRLPELARALGRGIREFREAVSLEPDASPQLPSESGAQAPPIAYESTAAGPPTMEPGVDPPESVRSGDAPDSRSL